MMDKPEIASRVGLGLGLGCCRSRRRHRVSIDLLNDNRKSDASDRYPAGRQISKQACEYRTSETFKQRTKGDLDEMSTALSSYDAQHMLCDNYMNTQSIYSRTQNSDQIYSRPTSSLIRALESELRE